MSRWVALKLGSGRFAQTGDTIVEVLVCIAIVSVILGGAFVTTRNSQLGVRNSQEHANALKLLEDQLEQMRSDSTTDGNVFTTSSPFCMYNEEPVATSSSNCAVQSPAGTQPAFNISINDCTTIACGNSVTGSYLFTAQITWDQVTGGNASETMAYRLYQ